MTPFTEEYYMRGKSAGVSNYENYSWKPELTLPACRKIAQYLGMRDGDSLLDVGCARGFYVKAFRQLGYRAFGFDISEWAITNCDPEVSEFVSNEMPKRAFDFVQLKDLCEHLEINDLEELLVAISQQASRGVLIIVPLSRYMGDQYLRKEDEADSTHVIRWNLDGWIRFLQTCFKDFNVNASYDIHGIKSASTGTPYSCGFFTLIRP